MASAPAEKSNMDSFCVVPSQFLYMMFELNPKVCPPANVLSAGLPSSRWAAKMSRPIGV